MESEQRTIGIFHSWWRGDALPPLPPRNDVRIGTATPQTLRQLEDVVPELGEVALHALAAERHQLYVARAGALVVACGWVATERATIAELGVTIVLDPDARYLWGFVTRRGWRGQGLYPRLLQQIVQREPANRFWIGHDIGNVASSRGVVRAGFSAVGEVYEDAGQLWMIPSGPAERVDACVRLFGIPVAPGDG